MSDPRPPRHSPGPGDGAAPSALTGDVLLAMAEGFAATAEGWIDDLPVNGSERTGLRILDTELYDVWLLRWPPSTSVSPHDHGESASAFVVVSGELAELRWAAGTQTRQKLGPGQGTIVERGVVHDVLAPATTSISVHVYSPPLSSMSYFDERAATVLARFPVDETAAFRAGEYRSGRRGGVDHLLSEARRRIAPRVTAAELDRRREEGAIVVDTRPADLRARDGELPGAVVIERNVLEWRLDPWGTHRIAGAADPHRSVIVVCDEGYASSLAAAALLDVGRTSVTDLAGGYQAWLAHQRRRPPADTATASPAPADQLATTPHRP